MTASYPKHPRDIPVRTTQRDMIDGMIGATATTSESTLADKLENHLMRLGFTSVHVIGIVVHLMTEGKVRVDFRDYTERIELTDETDRLSSPQAISLLEDFIAERQQAVPEEQKKITAKIVVQPSGRGHDE